MAFKPNYRHERSERARSKAAKAQNRATDSANAIQEKAALRKAGEPDDGAVPEDGTAGEGTPEE